MDFKLLKIFLFAFGLMAAIVLTDSNVIYKTCALPNKKVQN